MGDSHDDDDRSAAVDLLRSVDAESLITDDLRRRIREAQGEVDKLADEARRLRRRVEDLYPTLVSLDDEHVQLLKTGFGGEIPDYPSPDVMHPFDEMTGNDRVFDGFHQLLRMLHNTVPDYPNETNDHELAKFGIGSTDASR